MAEWKANNYEEEFEREIEESQPGFRCLWRQRGLMAAPQRPQEHYEDHQLNDILNKDIFKKNTSASKVQKDDEAAHNVTVEEELRKLKVIKDIQDITPGLKAPGELPKLADWDTRDAVIKETIALMRKCGFTSATESCIDEKITLPTHPIPNKIETAQKGSRRYPFILDDKYFDGVDDGSDDSLSWLKDCSNVLADKSTSKEKSKRNSEKTIVKPYVPEYSTKVYRNVNESKDEWPTMGANKKNKSSQDRMKPETVHNSQASSSTFANSPTKTEERKNNKNLSNLLVNGTETKTQIQYKPLMEAKKTGGRKKKVILSNQLLNSTYLISNSSSTSNAASPSPSPSPSNSIPDNMVWSAKNDLSSSMKTISNANAAEDSKNRQSTHKKNIRKQHKSMTPTELYMLKKGNCK